MTLMGSNYEVYELVVGQLTPHPQQVWGVSCVVECDCPDCDIGEHRVDAFNRGTGQSWYKTFEEAEDAVRRLQ